MMSELLEYRQKLIERLQQAANEFSIACQEIPDAYAPVPQSDWNVHQIAAHVVNVQSDVYAARARQSVEADDPIFQNFDADFWMAEHYDRGESLNKMLMEFNKQVSEFVSWLQELPLEAWSRESRHETLGSGFTTQTWVERGLAHIEEHLAAVHKAAEAG
jgi:hypothetical protein